MVGFHNKKALSGTAEDAEGAKPLKSRTGVGVPASMRHLCLG